MFTSRDFGKQWTRVAATLVHQKPFPSKLSEFRPISSLSTMRKLLGYVWLEAMGGTQFNSFQTGFLRKTDASHGVFGLERASELAKEWKTPLFRTVVFLRAFNHAQHPRVLHDDSTAFERISHNLYMKVDSDPEVFSRPALCARTALFNAPDNLGHFFLPTS